MRNEFILSLLCMGLFIPVVPCTATEYRNKSSSKFDVPAMEVPVHSIPGASTWIGGLDSGGWIHIAADNC